MHVKMLIKRTLTFLCGFPKHKQCGGNCEGHDNNPKRGKISETVFVKIFPLLLHLIAGLCCSDFCEQG